MNLVERVSEELKNAMRAKNEARLDAIRALRGEIKKREASGPATPTTDADVVKLAKTLIKQRQDAIEQFRAGNRPDLVAKDEGQIAVLREFLPPELAPAELEAIVAEVIAATGAADVKDMGKVMKAVMAKLTETGKTADGRAVSELVNRKLKK
jgi:uncharacterized protein